MRTTIALVLISIFVSGCMSAVPAEVQVTDVQTGRVFRTYEHPYMSKENMLGYNFYDLNSGTWVMLKSYQKRTITKQVNVKPESPEAKAFNATLKKAWDSSATWTDPVTGTQGAKY